MKNITQFNAAVRDIIRWGTLVEDASDAQSSGYKNTKIVETPICTLTHDHQFGHVVEKLAHHRTGTEIELKSYRGSLPQLEIVRGKSRDIPRIFREIASGARQEEIRIAQAFGVSVPRLDQ